MERLTDYHVDGSGAYMVCSGACIDDDFDCNNCKKLDEMVDRLAAYEDTGLTPERAQELAQAEKDGRLVVLPETSELARKSFVDGLQDYFQEASFCDLSTGIFGMSEGEKELASALMNALTREEAEAALKKREEDNGQ